MKRSGCVRLSSRCCSWRGPRARPAARSSSRSSWCCGFASVWRVAPTGERSSDIHERLTTEAPAWVHGQPQLLGQLLGNLLDNACKYSPPGTPITVEVGREDGYVTLAVQDEGVGLDALDLPHVFEPFYRSSKARRRPGVGLGLAVVERIAHVFGGTIRAESSPGRGSRFILRLPDATRSIVSVNPRL